MLAKMYSSNNDVISQSFFCHFIPSLVILPVSADSFVNHFPDNEYTNGINIHHPDKNEQLT